MQFKRLVFKPIDLDAHASVCVAFRRDSFICSFGRDGFFNDAGPDGVHYIERLRLRTNTFPDGYVHAWHGARIVGQMEMQILEEPRRGYVNLIYLVEEMRGAAPGWCSIPPTSKNPLPGAMQTPAVGLFTRVFRYLRFANLS